MTAAIYARVSTEEQDLCGQVQELEQEAAHRGIPVTARYPEKIYATGNKPLVENASLGFGASEATGRSSLPPGEGGGSERT